MDTKRRGWTHKRMRTIKTRLGNSYLLTLIAYLTLCMLTSKALPANTDHEPAETSAHREIKGYPNGTPPTIDGKLDDACWQNSAKTGNLIQFEPQRGEQATQPTTIYLAYDANKLYVAFECFKTDMDNLAANQTRRDAFFFSDDHVEVLIDTFLDGQELLCICLERTRHTKPTNVLLTKARTDAPVHQASEQLSHGIAIGKGKQQKGQTAGQPNSAIPFAELRFSKGSDIATWGINFWRNDEVPAEEQTWADLGERQYAVSKFGKLTDLPIADLVTKRPVKFKPYTTLKPQVSQPADGETTVEVKPDAGLDLRYPIKDFTVDLTLNPDFAQIEADPDLVNLSDIPLRFPEKRPFFLGRQRTFSDAAGPIL